jgi:predicted dithiol-disulfide oxidoreductase (DUF899 family)
MSPYKGRYSLADKMRKFGCHYTKEDIHSQLRHKSLAVTREKDILSQLRRKCLAVNIQRKIFSRSKDKRFWMSLYKGRNFLAVKTPVFGCHHTKKDILSQLIRMCLAVTREKDIL